MRNLTVLAAAALLTGCAVRARRTARKLFDDCAYRGMTREECQIKLGCTPENTRKACEDSVIKRMKFSTGESGY